MGHAPTRHQAAAPGPVLLVAPDTYFRTMLRRLLEVRGYAVATVASPADAAARAGDARLAIVDLAGEAAAGERSAGLRRLRRRLPVLLLAEDADRLATAGRADVLRKPFTPDDLERAVRAALARPSGL